ncbi:BspA family leucine-rich repeat surface protein [Lactococcus garvieae]|uniref:BspA family leucine-rich repeat surface protein n=1 Tax=Lactococcus garvieae TaxID=1363 RepID=UPI00385463B4
MNRLKLQSVCVLSLLVLNQVGASANTLGSVQTSDIQTKQESSTVKETQDKSEQSESEENKETSTPAESSTEAGQNTSSLPQSSKEVSTTPQTTESPSTPKVSRGSWGTSPWEFDESTGVLTIGTGTLANRFRSPWNSNDEYMINGALIKKIILDGTVVANPDGDYLFYNLRNLTSIENLSSLETGLTTSMYMMFAQNPSLTSLDLSSFATRKVTDMGYMFEGTTNLSSIKLGESFRFIETTRAASLGVPVVPNGFEGTGNWIREDGQSKAYNPTEFMSNYGSGDLTAGTYVGEIKPKWGTSPWEFDESTGVLTIGAGNLSDTTESPWNRNDGYKIDGASIKKIILDGTVVAPENSKNLFTGLPNVTSLDLSNLDTSQVTNMNTMFRDLASLTNLNLSSFNTSKVTDMGYMFRGVRSLTSLDLSNFDTGKVTDMAEMFHLMSALTTINLSSFNTSKVTDMGYMFSMSSSLTSLDLSNFDTSKVTDMGYMFNGTTNLSSLKLGESFRFVGNGRLGTPAMPDRIEGTGNWIREDGQSKAYNPTEFMSNYGSGDLTAGTYVGEKSKNAELSLTVTTDKQKYTIGDKIETKFIIKHTDSSDAGSEAKDIVLSGMNQFTLGGSQELPNKVTVETFDKDKQLLDTKEYDVSENIELPDLKKENYYQVVVSGDAVNNTATENESNCTMKVSYSPDGNQNKVSTTIERQITIDSGELKFNEIPKKLEFKTTPFTVDINNKLINRQDNNWALTVSDLRGTVAHGPTHQVDRQNWSIYAAAEPFKDEEGETVADSALTTVFVKNGEQKVLTVDETKIVTHDVSEEKPKDNNLTTVKWDEDEGIMAKVQDRSKLNSQKEYSSDMSFELRMEP